MKSEKTVWLLVVMSVLQTLVIFYLAAGFNQLSEIIQPQPSEINSSMQLQRSADLSYAAPQNTSQQNTDISILKETIQQELNQFFSQRHELAGTSQTVSKQQNYVSAPRHLEQVEQQLQLIIAEGDLSSRSIEKFSFEVSKLAPDDRKIALSRLAKAINNGQVKNVN